MFCPSFHIVICLQVIRDVDAFGQELFDRTAEGEHLAHGRGGDVSDGGGGEEHDGGDFGIDAVVGRLHRALVLEVGRVPHAADDRHGPRLLGEFAREARVDVHLDARIVAIDVDDEALAALDRQQPLLERVVADADHHAIEEFERLLDDGGMAAREGVERPGEDCSAFHRLQR